MSAKNLASSGSHLEPRSTPLEPRDGRKRNRLGRSGASLPSVGYHLPPATFECLDEGAGYFVSRVPIRPVFVEECADLMAELLKRGVELRFMPSLWTLHDAVARSTLRFSMIRMRNAVPRPDSGA